ncbi:MAG: OmpA family protein [Mucilaginibacter polytrichastri]|nr:OmpA family protein [Mucilaginibacter polytrichastri]
MRFSFLKHALIAAGVSSALPAIAQQAAPKTTPAAATTSVKTLSPASAYRTWSVGANIGILAPNAFFGKNDFTDRELTFGYGAYIKKQLMHSFALQVDYLGGQMRGNNNEALGNGANPQRGVNSFETKLNYTAALSGVVTLANINWSNKQSVLQPWVSAGVGLAGYKPTVTYSNGTTEAYNNGESINELYIPVGVGIKFNPGKDVNIDLGYRIGFIDGDNLDGFWYGPSNDRFSYGYIGLEVALGNKAKPQLATHNPVAQLVADNDAALAAMRQDMANERTKNQAEISKLRDEMAALTRDSDGDGVIDKLDKCPNTPKGVKVDGSGCEIKIEQKIVITEEDRRVVDEAIKNLEFDFGKATIKATSHTTLNRVAKLLMDKNFSLRLAGHTDDVGSDAANLRLSKARAEAVKDYLVSQGANASRVEATGYGESQPIASNKTAEGRQKNRRVEFSLF